MHFMKESSSLQPYNVSRKYDGKSADSRRKQRRDILIESAIRLFGGKGYGAVSLNAICAEAKMNKRYFYESFADVEALLTEVYRCISKEIQQQVIKQIAAQCTPKGMITSGFQSFFEYIRAHPERGRVYLIEALSVHPVRNDLLGNGGGEVSEFLLKTTRQHMKGEALPESVLNAMAQGAVGAAIFVGQNWITSGYQQPVEELVQAVSEICFGIGQRLNIPLEKHDTQCVSNAQSC